LRYRVNAPVAQTERRHGANRVPTQSITLKRDNGDAWDARDKLL